MGIDTFFDMETIPDQSENAFDEYLDAVEPPGSYKKQESIDNWLIENAERVALENFQKTALNGLYGEICSLSWAIAGREIQSLTRDPGMSEADMLKKFWAGVQFQMDEYLRDAGLNRRYEERLRWVGHNVIDFDLRFLKQRSLVNGVKPPVLIPADARHPSDQVFDTMKEWAGWRGYVKLDELVKAFRIEPPSWAESVLDTDGSQVWELYRTQQYDRIALYNRYDVWKTREVYRRMTFTG